VFGQSTVGETESPEHIGEPRKLLAKQFATPNSRKAVEAWQKSLTAKDQNVNDWIETHRTRQPQVFFDFYAKTLSEIFEKEDATVNFVLVGACDGTHDNTIRDRYVPNKHWEGLFVEPMTRNYEDLNAFMTSQGVMDRTTTVQAAVTDVCDQPNVTFKVPTFEDKNASLPHWMRREIGAIVPDDAKLGGKWKTQIVRCLTPTEVLWQWVGTESKIAKSKSNRPKRKRVHVLKIDAEGHDFKVLMGFLRGITNQVELPLIISYEAKSMMGNLPLAREVMEGLGYINSVGDTNDGFSLLRADKIFNKSP
jgi:FkbM family methyltransferase